MTMIQPTIISDEELYRQSDCKSHYLRGLIKNTNYILCSVSAAEYLGICNCTFCANAHVISKEECIANNIEITCTNGTLHTTLNQTINDLLADDTKDEQIILESLADQYYENNYADLIIKPENQDAFNYFRPMAELYYTEEI